jgi:hypothetical protein
MFIDHLSNCAAKARFQLPYQTLLGVICLVAMLQSGCKNESGSASADSSLPADTARSEAANSSSSVAQPTKSVLPDLQATETSPALVNSDDPRAVCRRFLELLQGNNRIAAENLLTQTALNVTGKAGLVLEPLSGPNSQFEIDAPQYATIKNEIAYVDCKIIDADQKADGSFSVSWIVKKQESGWRIAGLVMDMEDEQPRKMFSFENPNDVAEIKLRAAEMWIDDKPATNSERQADLSTTEKENSLK